LARYEVELGPRGRWVGENEALLDYPIFYGSIDLGAVFKINRCFAFALRVRRKPSWAGVDLGGTGLRPASISVALAEHGFRPTKHPFVLETAPRLRAQDTTEETDANGLGEPFSVGFPSSGVRVQDSETGRCAPRSGASRRAFACSGGASMRAGRGRRRGAWFEKRGGAQKRPGGAGPWGR
jgi:hypothetical protein